MRLTGNLAPQALMGGAAQQLEPGWLTASELARAAAMRQHIDIAALYRIMQDHKELPA